MESGVMNPGKTDSGAVPTRSAVATRPGRRPVRETTVEELFGAFGSGPSAVAAATSEAPVLIVDDALLDEAELAEYDPAPGLTRSREELSVEDLRRRERLGVVVDSGRPQVPLGLLWFLVGGLSLWIGHYLALAVFAPVAAIGAIQTAAALRRAGGRTRPLLAALCAAGVVGAAVAPSSRAVGVAVLGAVAVSLLGGVHGGGFDVLSATTTVRSWLGVGLAAAVPVVFSGFDPALAVLLFVLACSYDAGDHLVGATAAGWYEGPLAGAVAVVAAGFAAVVLEPGTLADHQLWPAIVLAAVACPLGRLVGSLTLPPSGGFAPGLRRLDSLIVLAPLWVLLFG